MAEDWERGGFGIYVHWPFCEAKCPYCDFNSHVSRKIDEFRWNRAYIAELERVARDVPNRVVSSVFFGGGTPSLMSPDTVASVLEKIRQLWPVANDLEVTLEANPSSVEAGRFAGYRSAGVSRISMGIQAMNDADLRALGRLHTVAEAKTAFDIARREFDQVSFDLIYARQNQSVDDWRAELKEALSMAVDHLSLYQLTIENGTAFGERYKLGKLRGLPDEDNAAAMFELTQDVTSSAGYSAYEVSNHAKPGAECRHNLIYWRYGDYAGIGPGAHGRLTKNGVRYATEAYRMPNRWLEGAETRGGTSVEEPLDAGDQATEILLMGLRLTEGVSIGRFEALSGASLPQTSVDRLEEGGFIQATGDRLKATMKGRIVLNAVLAELLGAA